VTGGKAQVITQMAMNVPQGGSSLDFCPGNLVLCSQREAINSPSRRALQYLSDWRGLVVKVLQSP